MTQDMTRSGAGLRAVVTGGTGFIGANLVRRLLQDGWQVDLLVRPGYANWRIAGLEQQLRLHVLDLTDQAATRSALLAARPDHIFHLAAHGAYSWQRDATEIHRTNLLGTRILAQEAVAQGVRSFVHTGSSSEYGRKDHAPAEDDDLQPIGPYAETKAAATQFCRDLAHQTGVPMPTLRLYAAYGPWEEPHRLMPTLLASALTGRLPPMASPATVRDFVWIDDIVDAILLAATIPLPEPGAVFNVGTGIQTSLADIVALVRHALGVTTEPQWQSMPGRDWDTDIWVADGRRIRHALGWSPQCGLRDGLNRMVAWLRAEPDRLAFYQARQAAPPA
jgi:dolichol-phosphate mannosyltransferase